MLIEFRVENHRSIRDEQVLSMEGSEATGDAGFDKGEGAKQLVHVAALYGANASGKSNVLSALGFMRDAVIDSHRLWAPDGGVPREPFAWGSELSTPSLYEASFLADGVRFQYGFVADNERFLEEWLHVWPHGRKQVWYERERDDFKFGEHLKGENRLTETVTRPNSLFLSAAIQNRHEQLKGVFEWFRDVQTFHVHHRRLTRSSRDLSVDFTPAWLVPEGTQRSLFEPKQTETAGRFQQFLRAADVGIIDVKVQLSESVTATGRSVFRNRVFLKHQSKEDDAWLALEEESQGTQQLFRVAPLFLSALDTGGLVVVDELEASFHPLLALQIVRMFNDPSINTKGAQLVFSTHDTNLLGTTMGEPSLRRDQVWLTEKGPEGATVLYPLTDYKPRKMENLERGYLQGRYGAIPFLGELAAVAR